MDTTNKNAPKSPTINVFSDSLCKYRSDTGNCLLHSHHFGTFLSVASIGLMVIAALLTILVVLYVNDLDLYNEEEEEEDDEEGDDTVELENVGSRQEDASSGGPRVLQSDF